jgi:hypothetical protein
LSSLRYRKNALVVYRPRLFNQLKTKAIVRIGLKIAWARGKKLPPSTVAPAAGEIRLSAPPVLKQQAVQPPEYDLEFNQQSGLTADGGRAVATHK